MARHTGRPIYIFLQFKLNFHHGSKHDLFFSVQHRSSLDFPIFSCSLIYCVCYRMNWYNETWANWHSRAWPALLCADRSPQITNGELMRVQVHDAHNSRSLSLIKYRVELPMLISHPPHLIRNVIIHLFLLRCALSSWTGGGRRAAASSAMCSARNMRI